MSMTDALIVFRSLYEARVAISGDSNPNGKGPAPNISALLDITLTAF